VPRTGIWLRVFVGLLFAVLPPILFLVAAVLLSETLLREMDPNIVAILVVAGSIVWAAILAILYARAEADELRSIVALAERGESRLSPEPRGSYPALQLALEERNRQVATLAREASNVPIDEAPQAVVGALVSAVRSVMRDPTWRAAVLTADDTGLLPAGIYLGVEGVNPTEPIGDLERWASVSSDRQAACRIEGPWGAFAVVQMSVGERVSGILYAPWEGRPDPTPAEIALLSLVGQHAATALEHSLLYSRVRSQADELDRLARIQSDFLRGVTHDLQTPLTSIGALATELRATAAELPPEAQADLETITHQAERLRRMVSQLLVASRLEAGALTPQVDVFAVPPLIERTWAALRANRPFSLVVEGEPYLAIGDPDRLEQVLWALLDNAVKYSPDASPIEVHIAPDDQELVISVRDAGAGMDSETQMHAFEQFYRSAHARRHAPDGSGVGLYAARGLVEAMSGTVALSSTLGSGTTITVRLPAEPSGADD
jgi:signal transduction histidine kinase